MRFIITKSRAQYDNDYTDLAKQLIALGADVTTKNLKNFTPLHAAAMNNNTEIEKLLIDHGADVNVTLTTNKNTPLHLASMFGSKDIIPLLIQAQAITDAQNIDGNTALHLAAQNNYEDIVHLLTD